ncbi:MAG: MlaD family protein [Gammaproteobacteria bacterium]|nr:MlaD family protein [Gammaproteobacteria bacterium]
MPDEERRAEPVDLPEARVGRRLGLSVSLVWLVPLVAALIGLWLAWHNLAQRGPTITILFATAEGLEAGKTKIKYKNVDVGVVTEIDVSPDRATVEVRAEMTADARDWLVEDTRFWVVRPRVGAGGVSGLSTLLSGSYIGMDVGRSGNGAWRFRGLDVPPVITSGLQGRRFILRADNLGSLDYGTPLYYRRIQVGQVVAYHLEDNGKAVSVQVFVAAPFDEYVTRNTRFWQASGVDVRLDASGFQVNTESLAALLVGGIAFQVPPDEATGERADDRATFRLYDTRDQAMAIQHRDLQQYRLYFNDSVRGLAVGAGVEFRGVPAGEVRRVEVDYDAQRQEIRIPVLVEVGAERLYASATADTRQQRDRIDPRALLDSMVARGLRAQLRTGNLLTGQLYVALDFFPDAPPAQIDWTAKPPVFPTMPGSYSEIEKRVGSILAKLDSVPFGEIGTELAATLETLNAALGSIDRLAATADRDLLPELRLGVEQARRSLASAGKTLASAERMVAPDGALQGDLRQALREFAEAARSIRVLADYLERHPEALIRGKEGSK